MSTDGNPAQATGPAGQNRALNRGEPELETRTPAPSRRTRHTFTVELQVDAATREVIASKAVQVETRESGTWPGWDAERLTSFIETHVARMPDRGPASPAPIPSEPKPLAVHRF